MWKKKEKVLKRKKLIDSLCESNINTVAEENVSSENIQFSPEEDFRKRKMNSSKRKMDSSLFLLFLASNITATVLQEIFSPAMNAEKH